jgi:hypothetical protein
MEGAPSTAHIDDLLSGENSESLSGGHRLRSGEQKVQRHARAVRIYRDLNAQTPSLSSSEHLRQGVSQRRATSR